MEKSYSQDIEKYAVKIKDTLTGSGVLVKVNEDTTYLITARHNFKKDAKETYKSVKILELEQRLNKISISKDGEENICTLKSIVYQESELDLIIFSVTTDSSYIKNLPIINILKDDYPFKEYFFYGYPKDERGTPIEELKRPSYYETEKYMFRLNGHKGQKEKYLQGFSGSGLFTEYDEIIYLIGIVIKVDDKLFHYECIDLSKIIDSINQNLSTPIPIKEDVIDIGFSQNIYTRILNRNRETSLVKKILNKLENKKLSFLKENEPKRKEIVQILDMDENELLKVEKELADLYLLKAIIYHSDNNDKKRKYFEKAIKFNARYKNYQLEKLDEIKDSEIDEIENNNEDFNYLQKAKLYLIEEKYDKVIEILTIEYIEQLEYLEKIEGYECLVKSYEKKGNIKNAIIYGENILELLKLSNKNNILEKAEISYKLSLLYEQLDDKDEALNRAIEGLEFLDENKENSFLEIKYKLEKQKKKLSNSIEERPLGTLTELFKQNPERYLDEYLESLRSDTREITNKDILDEIKVIQQQIKKC